MSYVTWPYFSFFSLLYLINRGSYTNHHFIWNLWNEHLASFSSVSYEMTMSVRFLLSYDYFKHSFITLKVENWALSGKASRRLGASNQVWSYDFWHSVLSLDNNGVIRWKNIIDGFTVPNQVNNHIAQLQIGERRIYTDVQFKQQFIISALRDCTFCFHLGFTLFQCSFSAARKSKWSLVDIF